jgi:hypothetical protein
LLDSGLHAWRQLAGFLNRDILHCVIVRFRWYQVAPEKAPGASPPTPLKRQLKPARKPARRQDCRPHIAYFLAAASASVFRAPPRISVIA